MRKLHPHPTRITLLSKISIHPHAGNCIAWRGSVALESAAKRANFGEILDAIESELADSAANVTADERASGAAHASDDSRNRRAALRQVPSDTRHDIT